MLRKTVLMLIVSCSLSGYVLSQESPAEQELSEVDIRELMEKYTAFIDSVESTLTYETGDVDIKDGIATLHVPNGFKYLNPLTSEMILTDIWGNPPSEGDGKSLGMIFPENSSPFDTSSYAINITYSREGYIDDSDAKDLDYDDLLNSMQADSDEYNQYRMENGYPPIELVGWAAKPYYDEENKKLHWAKELKFGEEDSNTLNYNIRILGRKGYLELNAISEMNALVEVQYGIDPILSSVEFNEGHRYRDFDPSIDRVAAVGIGGLIAGKALAKAGLLAKFGVILAKSWKIIAVGAVALFGGLGKFFGRRKKEEEA